MAACTSNRQNSPPTEISSTGRLAPADARHRAWRTRQLRWRPQEEWVITSYPLQGADLCGGAVVDPFNGYLRPRFVDGKKGSCDHATGGYAQDGNEFKNHPLQRT